MGLQMSKQTASVQCGMGLIEVQDATGGNSKTWKMSRIHPEKESCGRKSVLGRENSTPCLQDCIRVCEHGWLNSFKCPWITMAGDEAGSIPIVFYSAVWCFQGLWIKGKVRRFVGFQPRLLLLNRISPENVWHVFYFAIVWCINSCKSFQPCVG